MKRARLLAAIALAAFGFAPVARAAGPDPAAETQRLLSQLDRPEIRSIVQDPVAKARAAQQRAQSARGAGDLQHATELDALALTWAQVGDDLRKAAAAEKQLAEVQSAVAELEQKAVRTQALIEQTIARRGRAEQNLKTLTTGHEAAPAKPAPKAAKPGAPAPKVKPSTAAVKP